MLYTTNRGRNCKTASTRRQSKPKIHLARRIWQIRCVSCYKSSIYIEFYVYTRIKNKFKNIPVGVCNTGVYIGVHICSPIRVASIECASVVYKTYTLSCTCLVSVNSRSSSYETKRLNGCSVALYSSLKTKSFALI